MKNTIARQPLWVTIAIFTLLLGLFWMNHLTSAAAAQPAIYNPAPFGSAINSWLGAAAYIDAGLSILFIYMTALVITRIISRNLLFPARTYIFLTLYAIIGYGFFMRGNTLPVAISAYLVAKGSEYLAASFQRSTSFRESFRSGIVLGLAPLFYAPSGVYIFLLIIAMPLYMRTVREAILGLAGLILPILTYSYIMWGTGDPFLQPLATLWGTITGDGGGFPPFDLASPAGILRASAAAVAIVAIVLSLGSFVVNAPPRTRALRVYGFFIFFLIIAVLAIFLPCASIGDLPLLAIPASVVGANFFSRHPGITATIIYILLLVSIIGANIL